MAKIKITVVTPLGRYLELNVPATREVCPTCRGNGTHVNRAIDGHGLTQEDFDQDPDFQESYMSGRYDVTCEQCKGLRVVDVLDESIFIERPKLAEGYQRYWRETERDRQEALDEERWRA